MANQKKIDIVDTTTKRFESSGGIYFTKYTGLDVPSITTWYR